MDKRKQEDYFNELYIPAVVFAKQTENHIFYLNRKLSHDPLTSSKAKIIPHVQSHRPSIKPKILHPEPKKFQKKDTS